MKKLILIFILLLIPLALADIEIGFDEQTPGVNLILPEVPLQLPDTDWNGGWMNNGCSIIGGDIYCQTGYFYNLTSLNVSRVNLTVWDDLIVDGRVGIGTASPLTPLQVETASTTSINIVGGTSAYQGVYFGETGAIDGSLRYEPNVNKLSLWTSGARRLSIDTAGKVGIGTTSPTVKLHVEGSENLLARFKSTDDLSMIEIRDDADIVYFGMSDDNDAAFMGFTSSVSANNLNIDSSGNVGIGTSSPDYPLQVRRAGGAGAVGITINNVLGASTRDAVFNITPDTTSEVGGYQFISHNGASGDVLALNILGSGNVGIGTVNPLQKLNVLGDVNVTGIFYNPAIYCESSELVDQVFSVAGARYRLNISNVDEGNGITMTTGTNGTNITIETFGVYHLVAQPQVKAGAGGAGDFHMWLEKYVAGSGWSDISDSNIELKLSSLEEDVIVLATTLKLNQGEKLRLVVSVSDNKILLHAQSPVGEPVIPSIIFTMYRI